MGGGGSDVGKEAAQAQARATNDLMESSAAGRDAFLKQVLAAIQGDGSKIPVLNTATDRIDKATSSAMVDAADMANRLGFSQDTGRRITEPLRTRGGAASSNVQNEIMREFRGYGPGLAIQPSLLAQQGLGGAVQRGQANAAAKKAQDTQTATAAGSAAAAIASAVIIAAAQSSRAAYKHDIEPVSDMALDILADHLDDMPLSVFKYNGEEHPRLGLIIEDVEEKVPFILTADGNAVDLYSYASMAVAALKVQKKTITTLEARLAALEAKVNHAAAA